MKKSTLNSDPLEKITSFFGFLPLDQARSLATKVISRVNSFDRTQKEKTLFTQPIPPRDCNSDTLKDCFHLSEKDVALISYPDSVRDQTNKEAPLLTHLHVLDTYFKDLISIVHFLPFHPATSDGGFSVSDYNQVAEEYGTYEDLHRIRRHGYQLMMDHVLNHISQSHIWFKNWLEGHPDFDHFFLTIENPESADMAPLLDQVTRPRALPLLTPFERQGQRENVWTTFSPDQVDINIRNPATMIAVVDVFIRYLEQGADIVRLDAIAYLFKQLGTGCIHLPETHEFVQLLQVITALIFEKNKDLFPQGKPLIITETNVSHEENISYFGPSDEFKEADLVYNFPLPPLVAHAILFENATYLGQWLSSWGIQSPARHGAFFNMLATHDGIGVNGARGFLPETEIDALCEETRKKGGRIGEKKLPNGSKKPYELQITLPSLLIEEEATPKNQMRRFLLAHAFQLSLKGLPAIYFNSFLFALNDTKRYNESQHGRDLNRSRFTLEEVNQALNPGDTLTSLCFLELTRLIQIRKQHSAFHPLAEQKVIPWNHPQDSGLTEVLVIKRISDDPGETLLCVYNFSSQERGLSFHHLPFSTQSLWQDIVSDTLYDPQKEGGQSLLTLPPYSYVWLKTVEREGTHAH